LLAGETSMNERIKELAHEAGLYYYPRGTCCMDEMFPRHFNVAEADEAYTKFAELIIQECCDAVRYVEALEIKNHFGVE